MGLLYLNLCVRQFTALLYFVLHVGVRSLLSFTGLLSGSRYVFS